MPEHEVTARGARESFIGRRPGHPAGGGPGPDHQWSCELEQDRHLLGAGERGPDQERVDDIRGDRAALGLCSRRASSRVNIASAFLDWA